VKDRLQQFGKCCLSTDYDPKNELKEALHEAEIYDGSARLPIKTLMWVEPGKVSVACGYGASEKVIYVNS
jgi:hypothetical protein